MNYDADRQARLKLAYQVGAIEAFIKYGLCTMSSVKITNMAAFDAAVEVALAQIDKEATEHSKR
jgi:lactam utilization protein B